MNINKITGERIKNLRNQKEILQEELAKMLDISRATFIQIENGKRPLSIPEALIICNELEITMDELLSKDDKITVVLDEKETPPEKPEKSKMSISVPQKKMNKFKEVLLYILEKVGAKRNVGETVLYKLLYFIDFDYYEKYEDQLIGATYIKNKFGPTPIEFAILLDKMLSDEEVLKVGTKYFKYPQRKYIPLRKPVLDCLNAREIKLIDHVLDKLSDMSAAEISEYSHNDVPWCTAEDGQPIEYETVFYRTQDYSVRDYSDDKVGI